MIVTANIQNISMSAKKLARVVELVKGHPAKKAVDECVLLTNKGAHFIKKVIESAIANAENNFKLDPDKLVVSKIWVTEGTKRYKKYRFASRARISVIHKYRANLFVELSYGA